MQNIKAKFLSKSFLMVKFVISVAMGNRGEKRDGKHQTLMERPIKQQLYLAGFLTRAHHNLEENHSYLSQQLFKRRLLSQSACFRPASPHSSFHLLSRMLHQHGGVAEPGMLPTANPVPCSAHPKAPFNLWRIPLSTDTPHQPLSPTSRSPSQRRGGGGSQGGTGQPQPLQDRGHRGPDAAVWERSRGEPRSRERGVT